MYRSGRLRRCAIGLRRRWSRRATCGRELERLREGAARAAAGEGTLVLIEGAAGVGKTVLTRAGRELADRTGVVALEARGSELEQPFGFGVVRQLLEPVVVRRPGG